MLLNLVLSFQKLFVLFSMYLASKGHLRLIFLKTHTGHIFNPKNIKLDKITYFCKEHTYLPKNYIKIFEQCG